ncbi:MAG: hypothetical protein QOK30_900 [Nocardioidaceae bacterium]|jgi:hypothetical protein|nr:hypothetical protein [Nocardioidaceae bacterium]
MRKNRSRAALAVAAITATIPAVAAVGPVSALGAGTHSQMSRSHTIGGLLKAANAEVVVAGLDNPRQLAWDRSGRLLVAEAGHGSYGKAGTCVKGPEGASCIGSSGKISRIAHPATATNRMPKRIATGFLSAAAKDGTAATGSDGVSARGGTTYVQQTWFPPSQLRAAGFSRHQNGNLLTLNKRIVARISAFEFRHNPDGEVIEPRTDPYAVLALRHHILVADAAGNDILSVRHGHVSVWAQLPGNTKKVDPVPTSLARTRNGSIIVGTLYSLVPHQARVLRYSKSGKLQRTYRGFWSVTGVAAGPHGHIFASELFAGCPQGAPSSCVPGRVADIAPNGTRTRVAVPLPGGLAWRRGHLYVSALSIAPSRGLGFPGSSGQVWRLR